jgi:ADP-ribosyl-[dinitrogen reductase] hydrolase
MFVLDLSSDLVSAEIPAGSLQARAQGAYLGLAVGDALGATLEFLTPREIHQHHGVHRDIKGGGWLRLRKGQVTDDTEMSLALGEAILARGLVEADAVAAAFSAWMSRRPRDIGHTVRRGIARYRQTGHTQVPRSAQDAGNGACMRSLPVALCTLGASAAEVAEASRIQSHVTHHNPLADAGTLTVVRMVQAALLGGSKHHLKVLADALVAEERQYRYDRRRMEHPSGFLVETLRAVFQALFATDCFESALVNVVNRGGDADTTGAILGMIAGALYGPESIPRRWLTALEPQVDHACRDQALRLLRLSPHCRATPSPSA